MARGHQGQQQQSVTSVFAEILQMLQEAKLMPDAPAHMQIIQALEQGIIKYIQAIRQKQIGEAVGGQGGQQGAQGPPGMSPMGGQGGSPMGGPGGAQGPGGGNQIAPGGGAGMSGFGTPDPDMLRRTLAGPAAVGQGVGS